MTYEEMRQTQLAKAQSTEGWGRVPHHLTQPHRLMLRTQFFRRPYSQPNTSRLDDIAQQAEKAQNRKHFT